MSEKVIISAIAGIVILAGAAILKGMDGALLGAACGAIGALVSGAAVRQVTIRGLSKPRAKRDDEQNR